MNGVRRTGSDTVGKGKYQCLINSVGLIPILSYINSKRSEVTITQKIGDYYRETF